MMPGARAPSQGAQKKTARRGCRAAVVDFSADYQRLRQTRAVRHTRRPYIPRWHVVTRRQTTATSWSSEACGAAVAPVPKPAESGVADAPVEAARPIPNANTAESTILRIFVFPPN